MTQALRFDISQGLVAVVLSQPARGNPFDQHLCAELCAIANECSEHPQVCAVLIRAEGKYFSVGADLKWMSDTRAGLPRLLKDATSKLHMAISRLAWADAPVVIAVHGLAAGCASALTAMADFALAGTAAKFYAAYNRIGFVADGGGSYSFAAPRRVGSRRAAEFLKLNSHRRSGDLAASRLRRRCVPAAMGMNRASGTFAGPWPG